MSQEAFLAEAEYMHEQFKRLFAGEENVDPLNVAESEDVSEQSEAQSGSKSVSKNIFGAEQTVSASVFEKDEGGSEWVPYVGPDGGEGWQSVENPDRVVYDDQPPGSVLSPEKIAEPSLNIDPADVEANDYIEIAGQSGHFEDTSVEGIVEDVEKFGDAVVVSFVDGPSVTLTSADADDVEVNIDDDFDADQYRRMNQAEADNYDLAENLEMSSWPDQDQPFVTSTMLGPEDVVVEVAEGFNRMKVDGQQQIVDHIDTVKDEVDRSGYHAASQEISFSANAPEDVVQHEMAHAMADAFGYTTVDQANVFAMLYDGTMDSIEFGEPLYDLVDEMVDNKVREERQAPITDADQIQQYRDLGDKVKNEFDDEEVNKDLFTFQEDEDVDQPKEFENLIEELDDAWERIVDHEKADDSVGDATIYKDYSGMNANETFAMLHELMQGGVADKDEMKTLFEYHESLLDAYLEVFDPGDIQRDMINAAWEDVDTEIFEEKPFDDQELLQ